MRLIAYIRVSTEDQKKHGHSPGHQIDRVRAYCALYEHELADVIVDEGVSASIPLADRKGGGALLEALKQGRADGVVILRLDRLFREAFDGLLFFRDFARKRNIAVCSVTEHIDSSTAEGRLMLTIKLGVAEYDRDLDVMRGLETSVGLRRQGKVYGMVPFGCVAEGGEAYIDLTDGRERTRGAKLLRDPKAWAVRDWIVRMREGGAAYSRIAENLRLNGVLSPKGERHWSKSTLKTICDTHDGLVHLPMAEQGSAAFSTFPEIQVSKNVAH